MNLDEIFPDLSALKRALAKLVYKDLLNNERLRDIEPHFDSSCGVFYWSAQNVEQQNSVAYLPMEHAKDLDFELIRRVQEKLQNYIVIVAIVDNTGNILYYQITEGLNENGI
ncbi:uncharacterized protein LOC108653104 [Drosophila navojoa]|uniref:uncharacterized protein LOC108653104 n=1 Tax=Drosophila navojoa TaxID=7232 RepID=UPI0008463593|nr:uncharacterized protein LOC108653104 [Drosophila navojoa]